jgi:aldehyde:ferredoxin oxidoreductase
MLGVMNCFEVLSLIDVTEKMGLDVMSAGVALAWATEAFEKGIISEKETMLPLQFGNSSRYFEALHYLAQTPNDFYQLLSKGTMKATEKYGGEDFACVLGQEMAGYATGEVFFISQALGLRHSHLDSAGYAFDQKSDSKDIMNAVNFLVTDEKERVFLTSMVACLFARGVYTKELLTQCLGVVGYDLISNNIDTISENIQRIRWKNRFATGFDPQRVSIPKRFAEVSNWKGNIDHHFLFALKQAYALRIIELVKNAVH